MKEVVFKIHKSSNNTRSRYKKLELNFKNREESRNKERIKESSKLKLKC